MKKKQNKQEPLTKSEVILGYVTLAAVQVAMFFGVILLIGLIEMYANNFAYIIDNEELQIICRIAIVSFGFIIASAWYELDKLFIKFDRRVRKEKKQRNEDK